MLVLSARDFGAKGDGVTDDTAAIQAALDAAEAAGGAVVHLEAGTYVVSGSGKASAGCLQIGSHVVLAGDGQGETVIRLADGSSGDITGIIRTPSSQVTDDVVIRDLTIDGNRDRTTGDVDGIFTGVAPGVEASNHDVLIAGVEIRNVSRYAFDPHEQTSRLVLVDSIAHDNGRDGFTLDYVVDSVIAGNTATANGRHGFNVVTSSHDVLLANNVASGNGSVGLVVQNGSEDRDWVDDILVAGGRFEGNALQGVLVKLASHVTIAGAEISGNGEDGVMVHGAIGTALLDNDVHDNSVANPGHYDGIRLLDYSSGRYADMTGSAWPVADTTVSGNSIRNTGTGAMMEDGVSLEAVGSRTVRLAGNVFSNLGGDDLNLGDATVKAAAVEFPNLTGTPGIDRLLGGAGDERFRGAAGNDYIDGGAGEDAAVFAGPLDRYDILFLHDGGLIVRDRGPAAGGDGIDVIIDVEHLVFDGRTYAVGDLRARDGSFTFSFFDFRGGDGDDVFIGSVEADRFDGGSGHDTLVGGAGDDRYVVGDALDDLVERADGGIDTVVASVSMTLADNIEDLQLSGGAFRGRGNGLDNRITGTAEANELKGYEGEDLLQGGAGDDRLYGYENGDVLDGGSGGDEINGGDGDDDIDGGDGRDVLRGGVGDDLYRVDDRGDEVVEYNGGGDDTVIASIDWVLAQKVENLVLGDGVASGTGNALDNRMSGNALANLIDGGGGADRMIGGNGDDVYVVDSPGDVVVEAASGRKGGTDAVEASAGFVLPANVENLSLAGTDDLGGTGNALGNRIEGNGASNRLGGLGGNDTLTGNAGRDIFAVAGGGRDVVTDLDSTQDKLDFRDTRIGSRADLLAASSAKGTSIAINLGDGATVTLLHTSLAELDSVGLILA